MLDSGMRTRLFCRRQGSVKLRTRAFFDEVSMIPSVNNDTTVENVQKLVQNVQTPDALEHAPSLAWSYSDLLHESKSNNVSRAIVYDHSHEMLVLNARGESTVVSIPFDSTDVVKQLVGDGVDVIFIPERQEKTLSTALQVFEFLFFAVIIFSIIRSMIGSNSGQRNGFNFGNSLAKFQEKPVTDVTFNDVAGLDGAKEELEEVVDFLKNPERYSVVGAKIPKGCLLVGVPGTGKTLISRAVAGEAGVPFFSCSASEFIEMFAGVGASRVRDLFRQAKQKAPSILFIDEIDAVGKARGSGVPGGGNDEREQTINQLLTEMDGFSGNTGVVVIAATNRVDVLDPALLRPGRFDRQIMIDRPNCNGRKQILSVHLKGKPITDDVNIENIAKSTVGFVGSDLANLCNEAAIYAARSKRTVITPVDFDAAYERIVLGLERKNVVVSEKKRRIVAFHEAGHALVALRIGEYDEVKKLTILPRGNTGGMTQFIPDEERIDDNLVSRTYLENQLCVALGGRAAEDIEFGCENVTTGASGDFLHVQSIARAMVTRYGMGDMGSVAWTEGCSDSTRFEIDCEIQRLVEASYEKTKNILNQNRTVLNAIAEKLLQVETLTGDELKSIAK